MPSLAVNQNSSGSTSLSFLRRALFISVLFAWPPSSRVQSSEGVMGSEALKAKTFPASSMVNEPTFIFPSVRASTSPLRLTLWMWLVPWLGNLT